MFSRIPSADSGQDKHGMFVISFSLWLKVRPETEKVTLHVEMNMPVRIFSVSTEFSEKEREKTSLYRAGLIVEQIQLQNSSTNNSIVGTELYPKLV